MSETIPALQKLQAQGLVRHIGITGLPLKIFPCVLDRRAAAWGSRLALAGPPGWLPPGWLPPGSTSLLSTQQRARKR